MISQALKNNDYIGIASPSWLAEKEDYQIKKEALEKLGFRVKFAPELFASGWGYAAAPEERAAGFNALINDKEVKMIFFGGGEGSDDIIPLLDTEAIKDNPKLYLSYSDGTSILNYIWAKTGLVTLYGQSPGFMPNMSEYNLEQFYANVTRHPKEHIPAKPWITVSSGKAAGTLIGGYITNFLYHSARGLFPPDKKYVLFI